MQVTNCNSVKIYNLSGGKSLPDWFSERKRRLLQKRNIEIRQRIELIQDFEMPGVSNNVKVSRDGKFIFATGIYKPRVKCYEVDNLSMKFERCFDAEAVQFEILSDDYSKFVILQNDRSVEFHTRFGTYYKRRIPKFGRDLVYHRESADLLLVGASSEIFRFNIERGGFYESYKTEASSINKVAVHPEFDIIVCGTAEGKVEAWDPRMRQRISILDCALSCITDNTVVEHFPSVTSLYCKEGLTLAVGAFTGQVLLYDIRTNKPFLVKDHWNALPIKNLDFIKREGIFASADPRCVKFWDKNTGDAYTTIHSPTHINDLCLIENTGLMFLANEDKKLSTYFIPSLGPAPRWCAFLDSITEELEESKQEAVYDDYKFVTNKELEELHLDHLKGTTLLRVYMHGYFMDMRLYNKAKAISQPTAFKDLKKKMIRDRIEKERPTQIVVENLPAVNKELAQKLEEMKDNKKSKEVFSIFKDPRFKGTFENPDFEIDEKEADGDAYKRMKSTIDKMSKQKAAISESETNYDQISTSEEEGENFEGYSSEEEESDDDDDEESGNSDDSVDDRPEKKSKPMFDAVDTERFSMLKKDDDETDNLVPIGERLKKLSKPANQNEFSSGATVVSFKLKKHEKFSKRAEERKAHLKERAEVRRPAKYLRK